MAEPSTQVTKDAAQWKLPPPKNPAGSRSPSPRLASVSSAPILQTSEQHSVHSKWQSPAAGVQDGRSLSPNISSSVSQKAEQAAASSLSRSSSPSPSRPSSPMVFRMAEDEAKAWTVSKADAEPFDQLLHYDQQGKQKIKAFRKQLTESSSEHGLKRHIMTILMTLQSGYQQCKAAIAKTGHSDLTFFLGQAVEHYLGHLTDIAALLNDLVKADSSRKKWVSDLFKTSVDEIQGERRDVGDKGPKCLDQVHKDTKAIHDAAPLLYPPKPLHAKPIG